MHALHSSRERAALRCAARRQHEQKGMPARQRMCCAIYLPHCLFVPPFAHPAKQIWMLLLIFHGRPVLPVCGALLSAAAIGSLATTRQMCGRALEAPGVVRPLSELYSLLTLSQ